MKNPTLVGLNDEIVNSSLIKNIRDCFNTLSPEDTPLKYTNLFAGNDASLTNIDKIQNTYSIWANLYGFKKSEHAEMRDGYVKKLFGLSSDIKIDTENYIYTRYRANPIFTDEYGNIIFIHVTDNPVHTHLLNSGFYNNGKSFENANNLGDGWFEKSEFFTSKLGNSERDAGYPFRIIDNYSRNSRYNVVAKLEQIGIGKKKLSKPVVLVIDRDRGIDVPFGKIIALVVAEVIKIIPGIGTTAGVAIQKAVEIGTKYIDNPNYKLSGNEIETLSTQFAPVLFTEGQASNMLQYTKDAVNAYDAYEKGNYAQMANMLGIGQVQASKLSSDIFNIDLTAKIQQINGYTKNFQQVNGTLQTIKNLETNKAIANAGKNIGNSNSSELLSKIEKDNSVTSSKEFFNVMTMYAGGGYTPALPTNAGGNETLVYIFNKLNSQEKTPELTKAFIDMSMGIPTGTRAFDELILMSIENQIVSQRLKTFVIPAQIPPAKANCITKELTKYGITVMSENYSSVVEPVTNSLAVHKKKFIRNFK